MLAYKSNRRRKTTITSAADSPTGAFKQTSEFLIDSRVSSGSAFPVSLRAISPASSLVISNLTSVLSLIVFKTEIADSESSGPIPSPVISEILYIVVLNEGEF